MEESAGLVVIIGPVQIEAQGAIASLTCWYQNSSRLYHSSQADPE